MALVNPISPGVLHQNTKHRATPCALWPQSNGGDLVKPTRRIYRSICISRVYWDLCSRICKSWSRGNRTKKKKNGTCRAKFSTHSPLKKKSHANPSSLYPKYGCISKWVERPVYRLNTYRPCQKLGDQQGLSRDGSRFAGRLESALARVTLAGRVGAGHPTRERFENLLTRSHRTRE